jgi:aconitate hydratase
VPVKSPLKDTIEAGVALKLSDNITTDDIMPAGSQVLPLRSNIPAISEYVFSAVEPGFSKRAKEMGKFIIVGGENYGQGSSREHAAMAPMYLGLEAVIAKSFARIHRSNLINFGVLPLVFKDPSDYEKIEKGDNLIIKGALSSLTDGVFLVENLTKGYSFEVISNFNERERELISAGGLLPYTKKKAKGEE